MKNVINIGWLKKRKTLTSKKLWIKKKIFEKNIRKETKTVNFLLLKTDRKIVNNLFESQTSCLLCKHNQYKTFG